MEGNFPFHIDEIARLIGIKIVYLTDDPIRLKRKWKRDIDYRKKYDPAYFRNRFFRTQFLQGRGDLSTHDAGVRSGRRYHQRSLVGHSRDRRCSWLVMMTNNNYERTLACSDNIVVL